jgi:cytidine deaminase
MISLELQEKLISLAKRAFENSYTPYSHFPVGCTLITEGHDGVTTFSMSQLLPGAFTEFTAIDQNGSIKQIRTNTYRG